jgi:hypothetical protein
MFHCTNGRKNDLLKWWVLMQTWGFLRTSYRQISGYDELAEKDRGIITTGGTALVNRIIGIAYTFV